MLKIVIADDHPVVREGIKKMVEDSAEISVIGEASNGIEVIDIVEKRNFDVLLLDISMPGASGLDILKEIKQKKPGLKVLILSMFSDEEYALRALRAGAEGYLTKQSAPEELAAAIKKVASGKKYISCEISDSIVLKMARGEERPPYDTLSRREKEVLLKVGMGKSTKEIAFELRLSHHTINTYRARLLEKLNIKTTAQLIRYVLEKHLLDQQLKNGHGPRPPAGR